MKIAEGIELENEVVQEIKIPEARQTVYLDTIRRKIKGGKIFVYEPKSRILGVAKIDAAENYKVGESNRGKIMLMGGCAYIEALNIKNAKRKLQSGNVLFYT
jgi:hypothetical protein